MGINRFLLYKKSLILIICLIGLGFANNAFAADPDFANTQFISQKKMPAKSSKAVQDSNEQSQSTLKGRAVMININSDKLEYFENQDEIIATGSASVFIPEQNSRLEADRITYDQTNNLVIAENNVKITKNGRVIQGGYARIDLDKESALINNPNTVVNQIKITANTANVYPKNLEVLKGRAVIDSTNLQLNLSSKGSFTSEELERAKREETLSPQGKANYKIVAKEIIIDAKPDKNIITIKNANIYIGKIRIASIPTLVVSTDKEITRIETMLPEIGHTKELGTYLGPSHVFNLPKGSTLKVTPVVSFGSGDDLFGGGGLLRFTSKNNLTEFGYTTLKNKIVAQGEQNLFSPNTKLIYGSNSYINEGILGDKKANYRFEIADKRKLFSAANFDFYSRAGAGYAEDYSSDDSRNFGTAKFDLQGDLINRKPIFKIHDNLLQFRMRSQYDISVYGTGDTFALIRVGPRIDSKMGPLSLMSTYFQSGIHGKSPFEFDRYNYGRSNLILSGDIKLSNYISLGNYRSLNLTKDNWNKQLSTENQFYARVGPDDIKLRIGYDFVRKRPTISMDLLLGSGRTALDFDRLKVNEVK